MKDSGIDWIGKIPDEWEIYQLSQIATQVKNKNNNLQERNLLSLSYGKIKRKNIDSSDGLLPASFDGYNIIENEDIVLRLTDLQNDHTSLRVGRATEKGIITSAYTTLRPINKDNSRFLYYLLHAFDLKKGFYGMGAGVRQGLNYSEVKSLKIILPDDKSEQTKIAGFLDKKCSEIDSIIEESKKSIEEYKAWKQSVIFEAVTGKNLSCKKKNSGIEWISEIPETWEVKRLKCIIDSFEKGNGITKEEVFPDGDTFCVRYGEIYSKYDNSFENCFSKTFKDKIPVKKYFSNGGLLFVGTGELVEEIGKCVAYLGNEQCLAGGDIIIAKHKQNAKFLSYAMNSHYVQAQKSCNKAKLKVVHISATEIGNVLLALPPISEQESIAKFLDAKCAQIDSLISEKQSLIKDLAEYKKSLIFEAVTGKRRV